MKRHRVDIHKCQYARKGITFSLLTPVMASKEEINILTGESKKCKYRREVHNYDPTKFAGADPEGGPGGQWTPLGSVISHFILLN